MKRAIIRASVTALFALALASSVHSVTAPLFARINAAFDAINHVSESN
jgi:hypothetical protein